MNKGLFLITDTADPMLADGLRQLGFEVHNRPQMSQPELGAVIADYTGLVITTKLAVDQEVLQHATRLKYILRAGSGMEKVDLARAAAMGIRCISSPEGNRNSVGEHVAALLLAYYHRIPASFQEVKQMIWEPYSNRVDELHGKTLGILGYGNTGTAVAEKLSAFGLNLLAYDKYRSGYGDSAVKESSLQDLFHAADILSIHLPYNEETHHMCDAGFFARFKKPLVLVNTSRGKIVHTQHLLDALHQGRLSAALLDVMENEALSTFTSAEINAFQELCRLPQCIITPHIAGKSLQSNKKFAEILLRKLESALATD